MPSYIRLLTEKPGNIATPPLGHTALYASSGTAGENKYELYIKNPEGFIHQVGGMASGSTFSSNTTFISGATVYSGGYGSTSGSPLVALAVEGVISGLSDNTVYISPGLNVSGITSGTTKIAVGPNHTISGAYAVAFGSANTASQTGSTVFGSGNTSSNPMSFAIGGNNRATRDLSFVGGSASTASNHGAFAFGFGNTSSGAYSTSFGSANTASQSGATSFGSGNTSSGRVSFTAGGGNTASGSHSFAAGTGNTSSGFTHFSIGNGNAFSGLFSIGNGTAGTRNNIFTVTHSGVTVQSSGASASNTVRRYTGSSAAALTVYSGSGSHPLGFQLPLVQKPYGDHSSNAGWPALSANTADNKGMMIFDGANILVWTGGTLWGKLALVDGNKTIS